MLPPFWSFTNVISFPSASVTQSAIWKVDSLCSCFLKWHLMPRFVVAVVLFKNWVGVAYYRIFILSSVWGKEQNCFPLIYAGRIILLSDVLPTNVEKMRDWGNKPVSTEHKTKQGLAVLQFIWFALNAGKFSMFYFWLHIRHTALQKVGFNAIIDHFKDDLLCCIMRVRSRCCSWKFQLWG